MQYRAFITDTVSGQQQIWEDDWPEQGEDTLGSLIYCWEDGNYGCDCNRAIFFDRAQGIGRRLEEYECGTGRFRVALTDILGREIWRG